MHSRAPLITAIVLLLLPVLYVGSYLALVSPEVRADRWTISPRVYDGYLCHYRINSEHFLPWFYWPLEQIDRRVRPAAWELPEGVG